MFIKIIETFQQVRAARPSLNRSKNKVKIHGISNNHETQPSRGTKREEEVRNKNDKTNATYETTDSWTKKKCNKGTALERSVKKERGLKLVLLA